MNPFRVAAVLSAVLGYTARGATLELEGYMAVPGEARFVLSERETGRRSGWLAVGQSFVGYKIERFEPTQEWIDLRRDKEMIRLPLKAPDLKTANAFAAETRAEFDAEFGRAGKLPRAAKDAFDAGKFAEAEKIAREMLELIAKNKLHARNGALAHDANLVLGRLALKEGRTAEAIEFLLASAKDNPGSPAISTFGPNMSLARDLLEHGEREAVLQYFELCRGFWVSPHNRLNEWSTAIKSGAPPKFDANLKY